MVKGLLHHLVLNPTPIHDATTTESKGREKKLVVTCLKQSDATIKFTQLTSGVFVACRSISVSRFTNARCVNEVCAFALVIHGHYLSSSPHAHTYHQPYQQFSVHTWLCHAKSISFASPPRNHCLLAGLCHNDNDLECTRKRRHLHSSCCTACLSRDPHGSPKIEFPP